MFNKCQAKYINFSDSIINKVSIENTDLTDASFNCVKIKDINFSKVNEVIAILNRVNDIELKTDKQVLDAREKFIEIMRKIEMKFNDYSEVDKKNLVDIMDITYNKLNKEVKNLGGYENEWKHFGIRLFRLKKYLRSDAMEKY